MKVELITNWKIWLWVVSIFSFVFSIVNFFLGKFITAKIFGNDLKHLEKDVTELKKGETDYKKYLRTDLSKIFRRLGHIEKEIVRRDAICNERHGKK